MNPISHWILRLGFGLDSLLWKIYLRLRSPLPLPYSDLKFGGYALFKIMQAYRFNSVLDVGCGSGVHARLMSSLGKKVTAIDFLPCEGSASGFARIVGDFNQISLLEKFDCVWCSHVLEHQLDVQAFLVRIKAVLNDGGVFALTVPPLKSDVVGGHVSLWNAGLLLYRLVLAGFDCSQAKVLVYGYNISIIVENTRADLPHDLSYDAGDIRKLKMYFPNGMHFSDGDLDASFDGNFRCINWF